jgi:hypothetical protein
MDKGDFLWVIKGGPGCGKSSFMKRIGAAAENAGLPVEYIHCSGDPDSLDAVWLPTLRTGYADGTAPHVLEATYPGASALYLDLGTFYDAGALESKLPEIVELNRQYKGLYSRAYDFLSAAALVSPGEEQGLWGEAEKEKIRRRLSSLAAREFKHVGGSGSVKERFLSAVSCKGRVFFKETVENLCSRIYVLDNEFGLAEFYLSCVSQLAKEYGVDQVLCRQSLDPDKPEAVLLPELGLGFIADVGEIYDGEQYRHVRLDAMADHTAVAVARPEIRRYRKLKRELMDMGIEKLSEAKALHDRLEAIYNPHVDFDSVYAAADDHIAWLLGAD